MCIEQKDYFDRNISLLRSHDPALARRVEKVAFPMGLEISASRDGVPSFRFQSITLHSAYYPLKEAVDSVGRFDVDEGRQTVVYGLGFGYHILELRKKCSGEIWVIEPLMPVFRTFLSSVDLEPFLPFVRFFISEPAPKIISRFKSGDWNIYSHIPSERLSRTYFERMNRGLKLQEMLGERRIKALVVPPFYGGSLPTARFCTQALENLGHEVAMVECGRFSDSFFAIPDVTRNRENSKILSSLFMNFMGQVIAAKASEFQPDLILVMAQAPMTPETISRLKGLKVPIVFWFVEDFRVLGYWREVAPCYDHFFAIQRGDFFVELEKAGCRNHYYLPQACESETHQPVELTADEKSAYACDLSFMGAAYYNRKKSFPRLVDFDFKIWGTDWDLNSELGKFIQKKGERVSTGETVRIFNAAKINLNLHSSTFHEGVNENGDFVNPRTFEIAACSAFQLVDGREELHDLFRIGEEMVTFDSIEDLRRKAGYYLDRPDERKRIAGKARDRVLKEHTFEKRMTELLLQVFIDDSTSLSERLEGRVDSVHYFASQAGRDTELGRYLERFKGTSNLSLKQILEDIENGDGALSKNELLLLMVDQVTKEE